MLTEEDYKIVKGETEKIKERETQLRLLLKLRPGIFDPDDQARAEEINMEIKKVAIGVFAGFLSTSAFRFW